MLKFELEESIGAQTILQFNTSIVQTLGGFEQRIINWDRGLLKFDLSKAILSQGELNSVLEFHAAVLGQKETFLYKDYTDYQCTHYFDGGGEKYNFHTRGVLRKIGANTFKAYKRYAIAGKFIYRAIEHIDESTFEGYEYRSNPNSIVPITCSIDPEGIITASSNLIANSDYYWSGEFYVPVRFDTDEIEYQVKLKTEDETVYSLLKTSLIEVRSSAEPYETFNPDDTLPATEIDLAINLSIASSFTTNVKQLDSLFDRRDSERTASVAKWKLGGRQTLDRRDLNYLISLFRVARGRGTKMIFVDRTGYKALPTNQLAVFETPLVARFDSDEFTVTIEGNETYAVDSLVLKELLYETKTIVQTASVITPIFFQPTPYQINPPSTVADFIGLKSKIRSIVPFSNNYPNSTPSGYFIVNGVTYTGAQLMSLGNLQRDVEHPISGVVFV
ncbi:MAG: DUF2460 domain-containing protein, partial [Waterburya sp.]